ncbi:MAG: RhuM family protein [Bacteroidales bacterium]
MSIPEIKIYQANDQSAQIEVRVEDDTVWLTQAQMVELFQSTKQNISLHINNIFKEGELDPSSTVKEYLTVQLEGNRQIKRKLAIYSLDIIISVGYRVKSKRGTQFRIWANKILKEYLLQGHVWRHKMDHIEKKLIEHDQTIELLITNLQPREGIFYDGQVFDAYVFVSGLIRSAETSLVLIDNYIDEQLLKLFTKKKKKVQAIIYTSHVPESLDLDQNKLTKQYPGIEIRIFKKSHDRFLILDEKTVYHIGASLKDLGNKWFAFSQIKINANEILNKLE